MKRGSDLGDGDTELPAEAAAIGSTVAAPAAPAGPGALGSGLAAAETLAAGPPTPHALAGWASSPGAIELPTVARETYEVLGEHGRGGLGRVLRARDRRTGRVVAIKEMLLDHTDAERRFRREAIVTANLQHPAIVPVYEVGRWPDGAPFYAMKLVEGRSLDRVIAGCASFDERLALLPHVIAVADALAYAHDRGFLHRDLKPANILVGAFGETVVIDWGLAKALDDPDSSAGSTPAPIDATQEGALLGTPVYMPLEQALGQPVDRRADVYAVGAILYQLLAGHMPYADSTPSKILVDVVAGPPRPLAGIVSQAPPDLLAIVEKAMARTPTDRYPSAAELAGELRRFQAGQLVAAHDYSARQRLARLVRRNRAAVAVGLAAAIALAVGGTVAYRRLTRERDEARAQTKLADTAGRAARDNLAELHAELGRRELDGQEPLRALAHLAESARLLGRIDPGLAYLVGRAAEPVTPRVSVGSTGSQLASLGTSRDGRSILIGTDDGTVLGVDLSTGAETFRFHAAPPITDVDLAPDGAHVLTAGADLVIRTLAGAAEPARPSFVVTDQITRIATASAAPVQAFAGGLGTVWVQRGAHESPGFQIGSPVDTLELTPDGGRVLVRSDDHASVLLDAATGARVFTLADTRAAALDPAGELAAIAPSGQDVVIVRARDGARVGTLAGSAKTRDFLFGPHGHLLCIGDDGDVTLWRADQGRLVAPLAGHLGTGLVVAAFQASGELVATGDERGVIRLFQVASGDPIGTFAAGRHQVWGLGFSPDGRSLVDVNRDGQLSRWDIPAPAPTIPLFLHTAQTRRLAYTRDGATVYTGSRDGTVGEWDTRTGQLRRRFTAHPKGVMWIELSPDDRLVATAGADGTAALHDRAGALVRQVGRGADALAMVRFSPDGARLITVGDSGFAEVWDTATGALVCGTPTKVGPRLGAVVAPNGRWFVNYGAGGTARRISLSTCAVEAELPTGGKTLLGAAVSPDSRRVVLAGAAGTEAHAVGLALFDVETGARTPLALIDDLYAGPVFSRDGRRFAAGGQNGAVTVWDAATGRTTHLAGAVSLIGALAFARDDRLLIGGGDDGALRVWDASSGALLSTQHGHHGGIYFLRVRPDEAQVATAALDETPRLWTLPAWRGSVEDLATLVRCRVPWRVDGSRLVPVATDDASCAR